MSGLGARNLVDVIGELARGNGRCGGVYVWGMHHIYGYKGAIVEVKRPLLK